MRLIDMTSEAASNATSTSAAGPAGVNLSAPELRELVAEATRALARLDVARLQELALSCEALTRMPPPKTRRQREEFGRQVAAARGDMAVLGRVLEATRANVKVMVRLRELRAGRAGYSELTESYLTSKHRDSECGHGNN
jgi:hypothetical protein